MIRPGGRLRPGHKRLCPEWDWRWPLSSGPFSAQVPDGWEPSLPSSMFASMTPVGGEAAPPDVEADRGIRLVAIPTEIRTEIDEQERALQVMTALAGALPDGMTMTHGPMGDFWAYTLAELTAPLPPACGDWPANDAGCVRDRDHEPPHRDLRGDTWWP